MDAVFFLVSACLPCSTAGPDAVTGSLKARARHLRALCAVAAQSTMGITTVFAPEGRSPFGEQG